MPGGPLIVEPGLDAHEVGRMRKAVDEYSLPVVLEGSRLVFSDSDFGDRVVVWSERLIRYNRRIHQLAKRRGQPIKPYKSRDLVNLYVAVMLGLVDGSMASIAHHVVWYQPFANANHRTVTAALLEELGVSASPDTIRRVTHDLFAKSKNLLDGRDSSLTDEEEKMQHLEVMGRLVVCLQSIK